MSCRLQLEDSDYKRQQNHSNMGRFQMEDGAVTFRQQMPATINRHLTGKNFVRGSSKFWGERWNMIRRTLNVLMVEDDTDDELLLLKELERQGFSPEHQRVETKAAFLAALKHGFWDAVISDCVLPQFSGMDALKCLRHLGFDLPFIMVSGIYGEEMAVEALKAGANDYLLKGNLSRLGPALERELEAAADRHRHRRAEGAMQYLAAIVESSHDAIYGKTLDGIIVSWNPAAERIHGYSAEEIIGKSVTTLFPLRRAEELLEMQAAVRRGEIASFEDTERLHKSGRIIPVSVTVSPIMDRQGKIIGASTIARDITRQKQMEHERMQLIEDLTARTKHIHLLAGMLPICAACKRIRDDSGYWQNVEIYISEHSDAVFSHSLCPDCTKEYERQSARSNDVNVA
jgi:PAS domain S-box-containing protein